MCFIILERRFKIVTDFMDSFMSFASHMILIVYYLSINENFIREVFKIQNI